VSTVGADAVGLVVFVFEVLVFDGDVFAAGEPQADKIAATTVKRTIFLIVFI
jgi:hypothetical protein